MDDFGMWGGQTGGAVAMLLPSGWVDIYPGSLRITRSALGRVYEAIGLDERPISGFMVDVSRICGDTAAQQS